jgi:hypothetical protein
MTTTSAILFLLLTVLLTLAHKVLGNEGVVDNIIPDILQPRKWLGKLLGNEGVVDNIIPDILQPRKWLGNLVNQVSPGAGNRQGGGEKGPLDDLVSAFKDGMQKVKEQVNQAAPQRKGA